MMLTLAFTIFFIPLVSSNSRKLCCVHNKFTATMSNPINVVKGINHYTLLAKDYEAKLMATETFAFSPGNPSTSLSRTVHDFNKGKMFVINGNTCQERPLPYQMVGPCIPNDATFVGSDYMGFPDAEMAINAYRWDLADQYATILMVFGEDCVPLVQGLSKKINKADEVTLFSGYSPDIKDTSIFNVPNNCVSA